MVIKVTAIITAIILFLPQNGLCLRPVATRIYAEIKPLITEKIIIGCCENGKPIPWKKHRFTPEFARWILEVFAENSLVYNRRPEDVTTKDIVRAIAILNNRRISSLLEHPDLQEKDRPLNEKRALKNLKLLAGYNPGDISVIRKPFLTEKIVRDCCENGKRIPWKEHRLALEFARWVFEVVAENSRVYNRKPEDVTTEDFNQRIKALNNRVMRGILYHPGLGRKDNPLVNFADALKNLKLLAGYKLESAKTIKTYDEPVDDIISKEAELDDVAYNQIVQLITRMRNGNLIAKERLKKLFNPYFESIRDGLKYKIYYNNQIHDKKWAEEELSQQLYIKYENLIKRLKIQILQEGYWVPQIKNFIKTSLTWHYYNFYHKLQKQNFKEPLILNGASLNGNSNELIDDISGKQFLPEDILGAVSIMQKLISVMEEKNISTRDISLFFDFHLSGLTQRELNFKYHISRYAPHAIVMEKIPIARHISKQDIYHEFLRNVKSIKKHIDYILIIEQYPDIKEFRKGLHGLVYDEGSVEVEEIDVKEGVSALQKSSSAGNIIVDKEKPPITREIVIDCCENGKLIPWKKHRLTPEFAGWVLEVFAENSLVYNKSPEDVKIKDIIQPIAVLNNRRLLSLLEHPDLQEKDKLPDLKLALKNLKLLAGYNAAKNPITPLLTKETVIRCCKDGKQIQWRMHRLTREFARWILRVAAENTPYGRKPEDVTTTDFREGIKALNYRIVAEILNHPDLAGKEGSFIGLGDALKNLKLLAGYKLESAKTIMAYEEPVDDIISKQAGLDDAAYNQIMQLITQMRNGNLVAKERLKKLFNPYFENICTNLRYKIYYNKQIHDKKWAEEELLQQLHIKYEDLIERLNIQILQEEFWARQIKKFIKTSLTRHYNRFYKKLQKQNFKERLILNGPIFNQRESKLFNKRKDFIDSISGKVPSPEDILGTVSIMQKLISVMEEKNISVRDISLFFDYYLSGLTQRELGFKYDISRGTPHYIVNRKITKSKHISKQDIYHEFLRNVKSIKKHIDYILIIEQHPDIREFRKGLRRLVYDVGSIKPEIYSDTNITARAFGFSA
jgi:hypothetical protein